MKFWIDQTAKELRITSLDVFWFYTYRIELSIAVSQRVIGYLVSHDIIGIDWNRVMLSLPVNPPLR